MRRLEAIVAETNAQPREYQARIITKTVQNFMGTYRNGAGELENAVKSVLVESPTGSGKTVIGHLAAKLLQSIHPDLTVAWVAMRRNLLHQAKREHERMAFGIKDMFYVSMFDKYPEELLETREGKPLLLVCDEGHHDAASSMAHLHNILDPEYILGLTATPFRTDKLKLCFSRVIKDAGIHQLICDGFLSKYHHYTIPKWDISSLTDFYCADQQRWGKSIFYFLTTNEGMAMNAALRERGVASEFVSGDSSESFREEQLAAFRNGSLQVLVNCMILTEGFDDPSLQTVWVRDSSRGPTMQMAGRVFRKHEGVEFKNVVQSKLTHWPMVKTAMPAQQFLWENDMWQSLTVNPHIEKISLNSRVAVAQLDVKLPKFITARKTKRGKKRY